MEDTLLPGDKVIVNKLAYGPKLSAGICSDNRNEMFFVEG
jgi:signal peptidase I